MKIKTTILLEQFLNLIDNRRKRQNCANILYFKYITHESDLCVFIFADTQYMKYVFFNVTEQ